MWAFDFTDLRCWKVLPFPLNCLIPLRKSDAYVCESFSGTFILLTYIHFLPMPIVRFFCYYGCIFSRNQSFSLPTSFIFFRLDVSDLGLLGILIKFKINLPFSKKKNLPSILWALYSIFKLHWGAGICLQHRLLFIYRECIWIDYARVTNWLWAARKTLENKRHHASAFGVSDSVSYKAEE